MFGGIGETLIHLALVSLLSLISLALVVAGLAIEVIATSHLLGGDLYLALWEGAFGLILLYAGAYALGYNEVWPRIHGADEA